MTNKSIPQLSVASALDGTELGLLSQANGPVSVTVQKLLAMGKQSANLASGGNVTCANGTTNLLLSNASTLASATVFMANGPADGQCVTIYSRGQITALTVSPGSGQTMTGTATGQLDANGWMDWIYDSAGATWDRKG